jgi:hypothetical protein
MATALCSAVRYTRFHDRLVQCRARKIARALDSICTEAIERQDAGVVAGRVFALLVASDYILVKPMQEVVIPAPGEIIAGIGAQVKSATTMRAEIGNPAQAKTKLRATAWPAPVFQDADVAFLPSLGTLTITLVIITLFGTTTWRESSVTSLV